MKGKLLLVIAFHGLDLRADVPFQHGYYYQFMEDRLPVCTLPIHGLLHVADDIKNCGPVWIHWTFFLEWYCQLLKTSLKSHRHPWSNLANRVVQLAYLSQINMKFYLADELEGF